MVKNEIEVYVPELTTTPGWVSLSRAEQEWLQQKTSNIQRYRQIGGMANVAEAMELAEVKGGLKDAKMTFKGFVKTVYGRSERTAFRKLKLYDEAMKTFGEGSPKVLRMIAERGGMLLKGSAGAGVGDIIRAAKQLPPPDTKSEKTIEGYIMNDLRPLLSRTPKGEKRPERIGKVGSLSEETAAKMAFNALWRYGTSVRLKTSAQKTKFYTRVMGWVMEAEGIPGSMRCHRMPIPEGTKVMWGRPRKKPVMNGKVA